MATAASWNPEQMTDASLTENVLTKILAPWDGTGNEPAQTTRVKQLMWDCIQEHLMDTRNRYDPRLQDVPVQMGKHTRRN